MYNISDLTAMNEAELKSIASGMGLKKVDSMSTDDIIYGILDQQAIDSAANATEPKKRGRKPKKQKDDTPQQAADSQQAENPEAAAQPQPEINEAGGTDTQAPAATEPKNADASPKRLSRRRKPPKPKQLYRSRHQPPNGAAASKAHSR